MVREAIRLALSRALCQINEENRLILKPKAYLQEILEMSNAKNMAEKSKKKFQFSKR